MLSLLPNEQELLMQLHAGNEKAFAEIYRHYFPHVYKFIYRFTKSKSETEELAQEIFIKLWEHRTQVKTGHNFESYLKTVAKNHILNGLKKAARNKNLQRVLFERMSAMSSIPNDVMEEKEMTALYHRLISALPPKQKLAYILHKEENLSYREIANQVHTSKNTVKNQTADAIRNIRQQLSGILRTFF